jgi:hypothetical protein
LLVSDSARLPCREAIVANLLGDIFRRSGCRVGALYLLIVATWR